jgi:hypothetical protein
MCHAGHGGKTMASVFLPEPAPVEDVFPEGLSQSLLPEVPKVIRDELKLSAPDKIEALIAIVESSLLLFTPEQRQAFFEIMAAVESGNVGIFFIDAPGGTGKTFVTKAFLAAARLGADRKGGRHAQHSIMLYVHSSSRCLSTGLLLHVQALELPQLLFPVPALLTHGIRFPRRGLRQRAPVLASRSIMIVFFGNWRT